MTGKRRFLAFGVAGLLVLAAGAMVSLTGSARADDLQPVASAATVPIGRAQRPGVVLLITISSPDGKVGELGLANDAEPLIADGLKQAPGVAGVTYIGRRDYSTRVWLDPEKLGRSGPNTQGMINRLQAQNIQVAGGQIGEPPVPPCQTFPYTMTTLGPLDHAGQIGQILGQPGVVVLSGSSLPDGYAKLDGRPAVVLAVTMTRGAHPEDVQTAVRAKLAQLRENISKDVQTEAVLAFAGQPNVNSYVLLKALPAGPDDQVWPRCEPDPTEEQSSPQAPDDKAHELTPSTLRDRLNEEGSIRSAHAYPDSATARAGHSA